MDEREIAIQKDAKWADQWSGRVLRYSSGYNPAHCQTGDVYVDSDGFPWMRLRRRGSKYEYWHQLSSYWNPESWLELDEYDKALLRSSLGLSEDVEL